MSPCTVQECSNRNEAHCIPPTEKTWWTRRLDIGFLSLYVWVPSLRSQRQGKLLVKNDLHASVFKQCVTLSTQTLGKLCSFEEGKASPESVISGLYLSRTVLILRCETSRFAPQDLRFSNRSVCFPALSAAWKHIPMLYRECPWGNRLHDCVWGCWLPYYAYPEEVTFIWKWVGLQHMGASCFL